MNSTEQPKQDTVAAIAESGRTVKKCGNCQQFKEINADNFYRNSGSPSGFYSKCKKCSSNNTPKVTEFRGCNKCLKIKPTSEFYENRNVCKRCRCKRSYEVSDKSKAAAVHAAWRANNKEKHNKSGLNWKRNNKEKRSEYNKIWATNNADKVRHKDAKRRAAKLNATPLWANMDKIKLIYSECILETLTTGVPHEVDHIVPLSGINVCGLHVHYNLQVIPAIDNRRKGNRHGNTNFRNNDASPVSVGSNPKH